MTTSRLPTDHDARSERAHLSLEVLSIGDAFGGRFNFRTEVSRNLPPPTWYTAALRLFPIMRRCRRRTGSVSDDRSSGRQLWNLLPLVSGWTPSRGDTCV